MKLNQEQFERSGRRSEDLKGYDQKNKSKLEQDLTNCDKEIDTASDKFNWAKLHGETNLWEFRGVLEQAQVKKIKIKQDYLDGKTKISTELNLINAPYLLDDVESLMREYQHIDTLKKFETVEDKEDAHSDKQGVRIFVCNHNYFKIHAAQKEIMDEINALKGMELESLSNIQKKFNEVMEAIPTDFPLEETRGNESFREFIYENRPGNFSPEPEKIWLHEAKLRADFDRQSKILEYWKPLKKSNKTFQKPIIDIVLTPLKKSGKTPLLPGEVDMTYLFK